MAAGDNMDYLSVLQNFGLPVTLLLIVGYALYKVGTWFGAKIVEPVAVRHVKFLDDLTAGITNQSQSLQTMAMQHAKMVDSIEVIMDRIEKMMEHQNDVFNRLTGIPEQKPRTRGVQASRDEPQRGSSP